MDDLLRDFLIESNENLDRLDREVVELEANPGNLEMLKSIFRTIHTVKGSCGFLGLSRLETVAHAAEDVLGRMRDGTLPVQPDTIGPVLRAVDTIKAIVKGLEQTQAEPQGDDADVLSTLRAVLEKDAAAPAPAPPAAEISRQVEDAVRAILEPPAASLLVQEPALEMPAALAEPSEEPARTPAGEKTASVSSQSIRVDVSILDRLMNRVGELVLARNQLSQLAAGEESSPYKPCVQELNRVTCELQEAVMQTRMQEIGNAWKKIPRILRDLAADSGKKIRLEMQGADTELDRQVLDAIEDPLIHMVRNSADHGIEAPDVRQAKGKPPDGCIHLEAHHEGGYIIIEITDDGAGINVEKVKKKALEKGLLTQREAASFSDEKILNIIFEPGFSTAEKITAVSGRGVGMDVVRTRIKGIGGLLNLQTRADAGTTVQIKIPLTLAIISALIVSSGGQSFAIQQAGVAELVWISDENRHLIENVHGSLALRLRDKLLSLIHLDRILGLDPIPNPTGEKYIIVYQVENRQFGLIVDAVLNTEEIVVKPLGRLVSNLKVYAGTTILGDGRVVLILDSAALAAQAGILKKLEIRQMAETPESALEITRSATERVRLLLFKTGSGIRQAVPLSLVSRLEEFAADSIEFSSNRHLVQYRGFLLPLIPCDESLEVGKLDPQPVIVFREGPRSMGILVGKILDIVEDRIHIETKGGRKGVLGSAIIHGKATEIIDLHYYVQQARGDWFHHKALEAQTGLKVLLVEDSEFFRNLLNPILQSAGYSVWMARDGEEALDLLDKGKEFDAILTDIEMPKVDGFELLSRIRASGRLRNMPVIALTGRANPADRQKGLAAGFDHYLGKLDREGVLTALAGISSTAPEVMA